MAIQHAKRPQSHEFNAFYAGYVGCVPEGDVIETLKTQQRALLDWIALHAPGIENYAYADGKWTTKEVIGHIIDTEWIFTYRALRFARGDSSPLPGMDQTVFMEGANFADRSLTELATEFDGLRTASAQLLASFSEDILQRTGTASGFPFSVRAMSWIIAGHCQHHFNILKERYQTK